MTGTSGLPILKGGIIAAGAGSRLSADGYRGSKAMVPVAGRPLIGHALARFRAIGIRRLTVIVNDASEDCLEWLEHHGGDFELDLIVRRTPSSYASFRLVAERLSGVGALITTVDAASDPSRMGSQQVRKVRFDGDRMILVPPEREEGGVKIHRELTWERISTGSL